MLILSRKEGQQIMIGDDIVITIADVSGSRVRIAVNAPKEIRVLRQEVMAQDANKINSLFMSN